MLEDILKELIEIDKNARNIAQDEKNKKENIDKYIEEEYNTKKTVLDLEYKEEIEKVKQNYKQKFEEKKVIIQENTNKKLDEYKQKSDLIFNQCVQKIVNCIKEGN